MAKTTKIPANLLNLFINNSDEKIEQDIISLGNEINVKRQSSFFTRFDFDVFSSDRVMPIGCEIGVLICPI